jgi:hypothetical protein
MKKSLPPVALLRDHDHVVRNLVGGDLVQHGRPLAADAIPGLHGGDIAHVAVVSQAKKLCAVHEEEVFGVKRSIGLAFTLKLYLAAVKAAILQGVKQSGIAGCHGDGAGGTRDL